MGQKNGVVSRVSPSFNYKCKIKQIVEIAHNYPCPYLVRRVNCCSEVYAKTLRLGTTNASLKLKGIDGESFQLWII